MQENGKKIPITANSFEANGRKYIIYPDLSVARYEQYERLQMLVALGTDHQAVYGALTEAWDELNKGRLGFAAVKIANQLEGMGRFVENREHPVLLLCSLFMNREGEDAGQWDEALASEKIADWRAEGLEMAPFFAFARNLAQAQTSALLFDSRPTSPVDPAASASGSLSQQPEGQPQKKRRQKASPTD